MAPMSLNFVMSLGHGLFASLDPPLNLAYTADSNEVNKRLNWLR